MPVAQRGFALVAAIFLLVVLSLLAALATQLMNVQSRTFMLDVRGAQALRAAQAGLDLLAWQVLRNNGSCGASSTLVAGSLPGTLAAFQLSLSCDASTVADDGSGRSLTVYRLSALASSGTAGVDYVERQVSGVLAP
jgi:MSHA biogenesis protein MshP